MKSTRIIRKVISSIFIMIMVLMSCTVGFAANAETVISIKTPEELDAVRNKLNGNYVLEDDINLSGFDNWVPIGSKELPFTGKFDGGHHSINNFGIENIGKNEYAGLFGYVKNAEISGLNIDGDIELESDKVCVGAVCGFAEESRIKECTNNANISLVTISENNTTCVGGLVGYLEKSVIEMCSNAGNLIVSFNNEGQENSYTFNAAAGGIAGRATAQVINCRNTGNIYAEYSDNVAAGGIIGLYIGSIHLGEPSIAYIGYMFVHNVVNTGTVIISQDKHGNPVVGHREILDLCTYDKNEPKLFQGCYYLYDTGVEISDKNYIAVKEEDMSKKESFSEFDFNDIWRMPLSEKMPVLRFEDKSETVLVTVKMGESYKLEFKENNIKAFNSDDESIAVLDGEEIKGIHRGSTEIRILLSDNSEVRFLVTVRFSLLSWIKMLFKSVFSYIFSR